MSRHPQWMRRENGLPHHVRRFPHWVRKKKQIPTPGEKSSLKFCAFSLSEQHFGDAPESGLLHFGNVPES
jgi:hypothetical protein